MALRRADDLCFDILCGCLFRVWAWCVRVVLSFIICSKSNVSIKCLVDAKHPGSGHQVCLPSGGHTRVISGMIIHSHTTYICSAQ